MATLTTSGAQLGALAGLAGGSLSVAQGELGVGVDLSSAMVMSEAALEIKAAITRTSAGELLIEPMSSAHLAGQLNAAAISTVRLNFVATAMEAPAVAATSGGDTGTTGTTGGSRFTREQALAVFQAQDDVQRLEKLIGPFQLRTQVVPSTGQWIVQATDPAGRIVREQLIRTAG
ncbi:hypothetical protein HUU62_18855 [Rhodoferax sp. 4810]|nr:hypothetical protein [Rhodoferax jenense]